MASGRLPVTFIDTDYWLKRSTTFMFMLLLLEKYFENRIFILTFLLTMILHENEVIYVFRLFYICQRSGYRCTCQFVSQARLVW